jgi:hypothetical protein
MKRRLIDAIVKLMVLLAVIFGVTACQTASESFCAIAPQLKYSQQVYDAMADAEAARHLTYLKTGERLCGWRP